MRLKARAALVAGSGCGIDRHGEQMAMEAAAIEARDASPAATAGADAAIEAAVGDALVVTADVSLAAKSRGMLDTGESTCSKLDMLLTIAYISHVSDDGAVDPTEGFGYRRVTGSAFMVDGGITAGDVTPG